MQFSKNTIRLLKLFYAHPEQQFYIHEIGRLLKTKPGVFQRTLYNLEKQGVLQSNYKANARYFCANKDYTFYKEYKTIVSKLAGVALVVFIFMFSGAVCGYCQEEPAQGITRSTIPSKTSSTYVYRLNSGAICPLFQP